MANVPGVLTFFAPQPQTKNFAPRIGFAYSPGKSATTSIRGGFGIAYDQIFDNIGLNIRPPEVNSVVNSTVSRHVGISGRTAASCPSATPASLTAAQARAATSGWLDNQKLGYAINWNFGVQHVFGKRLDAGRPLPGHQRRPSADADTAWPHRGGDRYELSADLSAGAFAGPS